MEASRLCLGDSGSGLISYDENMGKLILHGIYILTTGLCGGRDEASFFLDVKYVISYYSKVQDISFKFSAMPFFQTSYKLIFFTLKDNM